jgi:hypothetical protein
MPSLELADKAGIVGIEQQDRVCWKPVRFWMLELADRAAGCTGLQGSKINRTEDDGWFFGSGANRSRTNAAAEEVAQTRDGDRGFAGLWAGKGAGVADFSSCGWADPGADGGSDSDYCASSDCCTGSDRSTCGVAGKEGPGTERRCYCSSCGLIYFPGCGFDYDVVGLEGASGRQDCV